MSTNPDNEHVIGLGPNEKMKDSEGNDMVMDMRYLIPEKGMLRFVSRAVVQDTEGPVATRLILQQYQWSAEKSEFDWYDIPLVDE
ncbi:MAG: hypothetical protein ACYSW3_09015 [Planctomycetota bacterium]|jgi:hypothetical protein